MNTKQFRSAVAKQAIGPERGSDPVAVVDGLAGKIADAVAKAKELGLGGDAIETVRCRFVREAEARWMRTRYATLDLSFTHGKRRVLLGRSAADPDQVEVRKWLGPATGDEPVGGREELVGAVPEFACLWNPYQRLREWFSESGTSHYGHRFEFHHAVGAFSSGKVGGTHRPALRVEATARMPDGMTDRVFALARRCVAFLRLFDVMLFDREIADERTRVEQFEVGVLWAPAEDAWMFTGSPVRPKGDPAILVRRSDSECFLVGYYDTPDERPIEHLVREFSRGPLGRLK